MTAIRHTAIYPLSWTVLVITASYDNSLSHCAVRCTKVDEWELITAELISRPISLASLLAKLVNGKVYCVKRPANDHNMSIYLPHIFYFEMRLWMRKTKDLWIINRADDASNQPVNKLAIGLSCWLLLLNCTNKRVKWDLVLFYKSLCLFLPARVCQKTEKHENTAVDSVAANPKWRSDSFPLVWLTSLAGGQTRRDK